jgi:hypothetical protein
MTRGWNCWSKSANLWRVNSNCSAVCHMQVVADRRTLRDGPKGALSWPFVCTRTARSMMELNASPFRFLSH